MSKVSVSLVEFNTKELLKRTLQGLLKQKNVALQIWVVDNASSDGSAKMVEKEFPQVKLITNKANVGFAAAHNQVLRRVRTDYVLLLNPDTTLPADGISKMVEFMEDHLNCGIASCKIVGTDGSLHSNGGDLPFGLSLISWLFNLEIIGNLPNFHRREKSFYEKVNQVGWVGGTLMMIRRSVIAQVGLINEDYFMYFEDVEFCFKAWQKGFAVMINPQVQIEHISGASSQDPNLRQWSGEFRGLIYFYKNVVFARSAYHRPVGLLASWLIKMLVYISIILRIIVFGLIGKLQFSRTYVKVLAEI